MTVLWNVELHRPGQSAAQVAEAEFALHLKRSKKRTSEEHQISLLLTKFSHQLTCMHMGLEPIEMIKFLNPGNPGVFIWALI
jgi:hypothetical protein